MYCAASHRVPSLHRSLTANPLRIPLPSVTCEFSKQLASLRNNARRQRKPPPKFEGTYSSFSGGEKYTAAKGYGVPIRNIGPIVRRLGASHDGDSEVKLLHAAIYGNEGSPGSRKEQLLDLQGLKGESAAANDNIHKRAMKTLESKDAALLTRVAHLLGFVTDGVHPKKLVPKICKFLLRPDPAMCDADTPEAAAPRPGDAAAEEPAETVQPARPGRKRKSAPAAGGRKAKAPRGRRATSVAQTVSAKDESGMHTMSEITHSEAGTSEAKPAEGAHLAEQGGAHAAASASPLGPPPADDAAPPSAAPSADDVAATASAGPAEVAEPAPGAAVTGGFAGDDLAAGPDDVLEPPDDVERPGETPADLSADLPDEHVDITAPVDTLAAEATLQFDVADEAAASMSSEPLDRVLDAATMAVDAGLGSGADTLSAGEAGSDSPDEVPLRSEDGMDAQQHGTDALGPVAGLPQATASDDVGAPAVAIPVVAAHAAMDAPEPGSVAGDAPGDAQPAGAAARDDGTLLADHPPPTPTHDDAPADPPMHDAAVADAAHGPVEGAVRDAADAAPAAAPVADAAAAADVTGNAAATATPAAPPPAARTGRAATARTKAGKSTGRSRRVHAVAEPVAAAATAAAGAEGNDGAPLAAEAAPVETGMRTRRRGKGSDTQDSGTLFRGHVLQLLGEFESPETTLVRDLRVAMEEKFGVKLTTFVERKKDVEDACGEFFTRLGFAETR